MKGNNSSVSDFFNEIPECAPTTGEREITIAYHDLTNMMAEAIFVLDFQHRNFSYVSNHALLLCGYSPERVKALGYDFFIEALHQKDLPIWIDMHNAILQRLYCCTSSTHRINYFACTFRIKSFLSKVGQSDYLMIYLKLKPQWVSGQPRFGICLLSHAVVSKAGNLCVYYDNHDHEAYAFKTKKWTHHRFAPLSRIQKEMLIWAKQGLTQKEMADKMNVSIKTIESIRSVIFRKFGVMSIEQAIQYATNRRLIYHLPLDKPETIRKNQAKKTLPHPTPRNKIPVSVLREIQEELDTGRNVHAIAKAKGIPDSTIIGTNTPGLDEMIENSADKISIAYNGKEVNLSSDRIAECIMLKLRQKQQAQNNREVYLIKYSFDQFYNKTKAVYNI